MNRDLHNIYFGLGITKDTAIELEQQTTDQNKSQTWHQSREHRLTSSIFKDVCSRRANHETLATRLLKSKHIVTAQMRYGIEHEPEAARHYAEVTGNSLYVCGFVVNPSAPHLGTSPDRKVLDTSSIPPHGLLEIKCPDKDSFTSCDYLRKSNTGSYKLKTNHKYFYQVMGQMAITGIHWCDIFIKCRSDYHLERIRFDNESWKDMKLSLDKFYFEYYLPEIFVKQN